MAGAIVLAACTLSVLVLDGDTPWPLVTYCLGMAAASLVALATLKQKAR
jgi:hypothetical protein